MVRENEDVNLVTVGGQGKQSAMVGFLSDTKLQGLANLDNLADEKGDVWSHFDVAYRGTWVYINQDGKVTKHIGHYRSKTDLQKAFDQLKSS